MPSAAGHAMHGTSEPANPAMTVITVHSPACRTARHTLGTIRTNGQGEREPQHPPGHDRGRFMEGDREGVGTGP